MSALVRVERRGSLGLIVLDRPERINALNLEMLRAIETKLIEWSTDSSLGVVFIYGEGDRGFCAGGDVRTICENLVEKGPQYGEETFASEYRIDFLIRTFPKPVVIWGHGAIMGAGLGLYVSGSTRLLMENANLAMPEVMIGLFPDVGASFFLSRLERGVGFFIALVALRLSTADAIKVGLADFVVKEEKRESLIEDLERIPERSGPARIDEICSAYAIAPGPGELASRLDRVQEIISSSNLYEELAELATSSDSWWSDAGKNFLQASPTSIKITEEAFKRARVNSLADCFRQDLTMVAQCMRHHDFFEGVRARLIDRVGKPKWNPDRISDIPEELVLKHFDPPWKGLHPLSDLE